MRDTAPDILVIGGGLHGLAAALHLGRLGRSVTIIERAFVGRHASGASAAGVRTLGRNLLEMPLAMDAMRMWHEISDLVDDQCGFQAVGQLRVVETDEQMESEAARIVRLHDLGYHNEQIIDQARLHALVPGINPRFVGAAFAERDGAADPHRTLMAFRSACERIGIVIREGVGVTAMRWLGNSWRVGTSAGVFTASAVINAAGAWGARIAALVGEHIPLSVKASMMMVTERLAQTIRPVVGVLGMPLSFKQTSQGTLVLGGGIQGGYDLDSEETFIDFRSLAAGAAAAQDLMPAVSAAHITRCWSGLEGTTRDHLPVIGPSLTAENLFHVFGFSGHGFQLVPATGADVAQMVATGLVPETLIPFSVGRLIEGGKAA